jgi:hypothetical protein
MRPGDTLASVLYKLFGPRYSLTATENRLGDPHTWTSGHPGGGGEGVHVEDDWGHTGVIESVGDRLH